MFLNLPLIPESEFCLLCSLLDFNSSLSFSLSLETFCLFAIKLSRSSSNAPICSLRLLVGFSRFRVFSLRFPIADSFADSANSPVDHVWSNQIHLNPNSSESKFIESNHRTVIVSNFVLQLCHSVQSLVVSNGSEGTVCQV